ncbi:hypothetical protein DMP23_43590 [Amycolatopsis sp. A1MSW2902]
MNMTETEQTGYDHAALLDENDEQAGPENFPRCWNMSAGSLYDAVLRASEPLPPEYVSVPLRDSTTNPELAVALAEWNLLWEAAQFRRRLFDEEDLPPAIRTVADRGDHNVVFVPRTHSRYYEYLPLLHLIPKATLKRYGLPLMRRGTWPTLSDFSRVDRFLPEDFGSRLARAWGATVWRRLNSGSSISSFAKHEPIRLLAHNLDFWIPPVTEVIQEILRDLPTVDNGVQEEAPRLVDGTVFEDAIMANPRMGSDLWQGEAEAAETVDRTVDTADADGRLRGIIEAVRANRVEDDFSERWSNARIDFERKLHHTRAKVKIRFVELTDTIPVQGPEAEVIGHCVTADFLALLDPTSRQIVVLLTSGHTNLGDVAGILGYRNHSPVSKRLKRIREQAVKFLQGYE